MIRTFTFVTLAAAVLLSAVSALAQQKVMLSATEDVGVSSVRGHFLESSGSAPSARPSPESELERF